MTERPKTLNGITTMFRTGLGHCYLTINELNDKPYELLVTVGKSGKSTTAKAEAIGRLVSLCLRRGIEVEKIIEQLSGIGGENAMHDKDRLILSIPDGIAGVLRKRYIKGG